jgi:DNA-binding protein YbaB
MTEFDLQKTIADVTAHSEQLAKRMREIHGEGSDDNALVTVTCSPSGKLVDIAFDPKSRRMDTADLRDAVVTAAQRAADDAQAKTTEAMSEMTSGAGILGGDMVREMQQKMDDVNTMIREQQEKLRAKYAEATTRK